MAINPKLVGMLTGAAAGVAVGAGILQGLGIDTAAVASDVAIVVTQGLAGCPADPTPVCAAGGRLIAAVTLLGLAALCAWIGHRITPAKASVDASAPPPAVPGAGANPLD